MHCAKREYNDFIKLDFEDSLLMLFFFGSAAV